MNRVIRQTGIDLQGQLTIPTEIQIGLLYLTAGASMSPTRKALLATAIPIVLVTLLFGVLG